MILLSFLEEFRHGLIFKCYFISNRNIEFLIAVC